jgi:hypothetical protein
MKTVASDIEPTFTPSIGSGNASATIEAASRPTAPRSVA